MCSRLLVCPCPVQSQYTTLRQGGLNLTTLALWYLSNVSQSIVTEPICRAIAVVLFRKCWPPTRGRGSSV